MARSSDLPSGSDRVTVMKGRATSLREGAIAREAIAARRPRQGNVPPIGSASVATLLPVCSR